MNRINRFPVLRGLVNARLDGTGARKRPLHPESQKESSMNKREYFEAAVNGGESGHVPCMAWVHFVTDALPGEEVACRHATWLRTHDWDI